jgi:hypothetical protein
VTGGYTTLSHGGCRIADQPSSPEASDLVDPLADRPEEADAEADDIGDFYAAQDVAFADMRRRYATWPPRELAVGVTSGLDVAPCASATAAPRG